MNVSIYKFSQLMVAFIILKQIGYTGHNSIQQITEIHFCLHENRGDLIILPCKKTQFSVCIRRVINGGFGMKERKHEAPPRYDAAFKEGAIRLVTEEGRPMREVAEELGVCTDTIRNWLKASGIQPKETERQNRLERRQRDLKAEIRSLRKQLAQKDEVIDILKKSVGILSKP